MWSLKLLEFTGERVVPGLVDPNLFNEHLARYRFAARFAEHGRVLDAGCGSGYGTAELANAASVVAMDISADAVAHARAMFARPGVCFLQGACEALPFADASFDLLVAFEVIEHVEGWQQMLREARRVLKPSGVLLVSTPNKGWYAESRAEAGPNPYHVHEFEYGEFAAALEATFPHVQLWSQNHSEAITFVRGAFVPGEGSSGVLDAPPDKTPEQAHFFLAACSASPVAGTRAFAWLPEAGNVLRERQHHIALLEGEIEKKNAWLAAAHDSKARLLQEHEEVLTELHKSNNWAAQLDLKIDEARTVNGELQLELKATHAGYREHVARLEADAVGRLGWIRDLEEQLTRGRAEIERLARENGEQKKTIAERTQWAQSLDQELRAARAELAAFENTKFVRFGRRLQLLPGKASGESE